MTGNKRYECNNYNGFTRKVINIWDRISDVRWGRFFKFSFFSRLYIIRVFDVMKLKDYPVMRRVVLNVSNVKQPLISLDGYQTLQYLQERVN